VTGKETSPVNLSIFLSIFFSISFRVSAHELYLDFLMSSCISTLHCKIEIKVSHQKAIRACPIEARQIVTDGV